MGLGRRVGTDRYLGTDKSPTYKTCKCNPDDFIFTHSQYVHMSVYWVVFTLGSSPLIFFFLFFIFAFLSQNDNI